MEKSGKDKEKGQKVDAAETKKAGATTRKKRKDIVDLLTDASNRHAPIGDSLLTLADQKTTEAKDIYKQLKNWGYTVSLKDVTLLFRLYKENGAIGEFAHTIY